MGPQHVLWWQANVQPHIDEDLARPDHGWNWMLFAPLTRVTGLAAAHKPAGYAVGLVVRGAEPWFIPCAMVLLVGRARALDDSSKRSAYVWYLSTAPEEALLDIQEYRLESDDVPKQLGSIALDTAITHSLNSRRRGRLALHAATKGGEALLAWYRRKGMQVFPEAQRLPFEVRRLLAPNDGRYCYYTIPEAVEASRRLDHLR